VRLEVSNVSVAYGGVSALDDVSLRLEPAEIVGIIGPNGSGKTTLLDVISGHTPAQAGSVVLDGVDLRHHLPEDRAPLGLVRSFQDARLFPNLTVEETLLVAEDARSSGGVLGAALTLPRSRRREHAKRRQVNEAMLRLGLLPFRDKLVSELSTGTRRIVDLAAIAAARPKVLLLDEPTAGIAQREAEAFLPLLRRLHEATGASVCLVEHDVPMVFALSHRVVVMEAGRVVTTGTPEQVMTDPIAVAAYLGASQEALARSGRREPRAARKRARRQRGDGRRDDGTANGGNRPASRATAGRLSTSGRRRS
jgi:branched-chain amino acid transport system ATP-binding protein